MNTMQSQSDSVEERGFEVEATLVPDLEPEPEPMPLQPPAGEILRKAREERGESLSDVARMLKLSAHQLEALENGRYDVLPGPTFVRGFLRNYANHLGIPPDPLLEGISARTPTAADLSSMLKLDGNVQPAASPRPRSGVLPVVLIVLLLLVLAGLIAGVYLGWFGKVRFGGFTSVSAQEKQRVEIPARKKVSVPMPEKPQAAAPTRGMLLAAPTSEKPSVSAPMPEKPQAMTPASGMLLTAAASEKPSVSALAPEKPQAMTPAPGMLLAAIAPVPEAPPAAAPVEEAPSTATPEKKTRFEPEVIKLAPPVPVNIAPESSNPPPLLGGGPDSQAVPSAPSVATLRLLFNASTLAQVRDSSGKLIFTRTGIKGSTSSVKGMPPLSIMVKQASSVRLEFNGEMIDLKNHTSRDGIARLTLQ